MFKDGPNHDIFDRLYKKSSQYEHLPSQVTDNIYFLNRHCKFLSYAEKENVIILLKKRDPQLESAISNFKANKITKQHLKDIFYAILYPKRVSKKHNENVNPLEAEPKNLRSKKSPEGFEFRRDTFLAKQDLALDPLSSNTGHYKYEDIEAKAAHKRMEYMNSLGLQRENKNAKPIQRTNAHNKTRSVMHMPNYYSNMSLIHEEPEEKPEKPQRKLSEIDQFLQKLQHKVDFYTKQSTTTSFAGKYEAQNLSMTSAAIRVETFQDQSIESHHNERSYRENLTRSMGYPGDNLESLHSESFLRKRARAINEEEYKQQQQQQQQQQQHNRVSSSPPIHKQEKRDSPNILGVTVIQNPELMNPFMSSSITTGRVNNPVTRQKDEDILAASGRGNNRIFILQHMGTEADSTTGEPARIRRIEDALEELRNSGVSNTRTTTEEFLYSEPVEQLKQQQQRQKTLSPEKKNTYVENNLVGEKSPGFINSMGSPTIPLESERRTVISSAQVVNTQSESERYYKEAVEMGKKLLDSMKTGESTPQFTSFDRNGLVSCAVPETKARHTETLFEVPVDSAFAKPDLVLDTPIQSAESESEVKSEEKENSESFKPGRMTLKELLIESSTSQPIPLNQDKPQYVPTLSANVTPKSISPILIDSKTDLGDSGSFGGNKAERFVSVNLIKRIFEENGIFAEDIVDEIFRYLGEFIVNKNYFTQIMTDYLNCLPQDCPIKPKDISTKIFEICDRNSDGLISVNDLGSRASLFSQVRKGPTKERVLFNLLDPQSRGFIIESDIVNALTKAQAQACSNGTNIFDDYEELLKESRKIVKDLDKEGKGIITYWDIFLWKDTESFAELSRKLQKYANNDQKTDTFTSAKKPGSSPKNTKNIFYTAQKMFDDNEHEHASPTGFKPFSSVIQDVGTLNDDLMESHRPAPKSQAFDNISLIPSKEVSSDKSSSIKQTQQIVNFTARLHPENPELETSLDANMRRRSSITGSVAGSKFSLGDMLGTGSYYAAPVSIKYKETTSRVKGFSEYLKEHTREESELEPTASVELPSKIIGSSECRTANSIV